MPILLLQAAAAAAEVLTQDCQAAPAAAAAEVARLVRGRPVKEGTAETEEAGAAAVAAAPARPGKMGELVLEAMEVTVFQVPLVAQELSTRAAAAADLALALTVPAVLEAAVQEVQEDQTQRRGP